MIKFRNVSIKYNGEALFKDISLDIFDGEKVLITGKSGIGKSSLLKAILGFADFNGHIEVNNYPVNSSNIDKIRKFVGYMPQEVSFPMSSTKEILNFSLDSKENVKVAKETAFKLMEEFKIEKSLLEKQVSEISGGQKQRILLALCAAQNKSILLLDEPDSSIDNENKKIVRDYLLKLNKTILIVSHDLEWNKYMEKTINLDNYGKDN